MSGKRLGHSAEGGGGGVGIKLCSIGWTRHNSSSML